MTLKSRENKLPPPNYYASILAHLVRAYPGAKISVQTMESLKPAWDLLWQSGKAAEVAAKTTCSCDGKHITLSPVFDVSVVRGAYRAPAGTARGALFEPEKMRESAPVERALANQARAAGQAGRIVSQAAKIEARLQKVKNPQEREQLLRTLELQKAQLKEKQALAAQIGAELEQLRVRFQSAQAAEQAAPKKPPVQAAAPEPKSKPLTKVAPPPKPKQDRPKAVPPEKRPAPAPAPAPAQTAAADQAILTAIKGLLPEMAKTLASSLKGA